MSSKATSKAAKTETLRRFANPRLAREWKTVSAMLHIYCRDKHAGNLCPECQALMSYVNLRLDRCRFGEEKPTCAKCPVHCYQRDRRQQIKDVMRYSGPKMIWEHPILSFWHLWDGWIQKPKEIRSNLSIQPAPAVKP